MGLISTILGGKTNVQLIMSDGSVLSFDAAVTEAHGRMSPPTEFEIEDGTTISDNIIIKPFTLEIDGIISDTPLSGSQALSNELLTTAVSTVTPPLGIVAAAAGLALASAIAGAMTPSQSAYENLLNLQDSKEAFDVQTSLKTYEDMWIKDLKVNRDAQSGNILAVKLSLIQLLIVEPQTTNLTIYKVPNTAAPEENVGRQATDKFGEGTTVGAHAVTSFLGN